MDKALVAQVCRSEFSFQKTHTKSGLAKRCLRDSFKCFKNVLNVLLFILLSVLHYLFATQDPLGRRETSDRVIRHGGIFPLGSTASWDAVTKGWPSVPDHSKTRQWVCKAGQVNAHGLKTVITCYCSAHSC